MYIYTVTTAIECVKRNSYPWCMPRPPFAPTDQQRARLAKLARLGRRRRALYEEIWAEVAAAHAEKIPVLHIAEQLGVERKTVYGHLPPKPNDTEQLRADD